MNYAIVEDGIVVNLAVSDEPLADNWIASENAEIGDLYVDGEFSKPPPDFAAALYAFQTERDRRLALTDWLAIRASEPGGTPMTAAQLAYRQALRAMDEAEDFDPVNPIWPVEA